MWREILAIAADIITVAIFVFVLLRSFGPTLRRLSRYAKTARTEAIKMTSPQRWTLSFAITMSIAYIFMIAAYIFVVASGFIEFSLSMVLRLIAGAGALWFFTIAEVWGLKEKWGVKVILAASLSFIALFIAGFALSDMTLLEKIAYPAATFGIACIIVAVRLYIERKREDRRPSKEENKKLSFDQDKYNTELQQRIEKQSGIVRHMPDNELKAAYEKMLDNPDKQDAALMIACYREVERRYIAVGWFWKRCLNRKEYKEWKDFNERMEAKAARFASEVIQKHKSEA